jgi:guanylate kinase
MEALEDRIRKRNADNDEIIELRLKNARYEISCCEEFDYRIVNDSFDKAVFDLKNIIINHRYLSRRV